MLVWMLFRLRGPRIANSSPSWLSGFACSAFTPCVQLGCCSARRKAESQSAAFAPMLPQQRALLQPPLTLRRRLGVSGAEQHISKHLGQAGTSRTSTRSLRRCMVQAKALCPYSNSYRRASAGAASITSERAAWCAQAARSSSRSTSRLTTSSSLPCGCLALHWPDLSASRLQSGSCAQPGTLVHICTLACPGP